MWVFACKLSHFKVPQPFISFCTPLWKFLLPPQLLHPLSNILTIPWNKKHHHSQRALGCTAKSSKKGARNANFMVEIAYDSGVVLCKQYHGTITGEKFKAIFETEFSKAFAKCKKPCTRRILMDNCTRQNAKAVVPALNKAKTIRFKIPARSPDLNPIENIFHIIKKRLREEALKKKITKESFEEFSLRCTRMVENFPINIVNKTIDSMPGRIKLMIGARCNRIKY